MFKPNTKNLRVLTPDGYKTFEGIQKLERECCRISFEGGRTLTCSINHPVCINAFGNEYRKAALLEIGQRVFSETGWLNVSSVTPVGKREVFDLVNVQDTLCYYTDGILSHNCVFIDRSTSSVSTRVLKKIEKDAKDPIAWFDENLWPLEDEERRKNAAFKIWEFPERKRVYSLGSDVSSGVGRANSTIVVLDITDLTDIRQVCEYACNTIHSKAFKNIIIRVANMYGVPPMLVERNNDGTGICDSLAEDRIYQNRLVNYNPLKDAENAQLFNLPGITSHNNTKNNLVSNARYWLNELMSVTIRSIDIKIEMETFGQKKNGTWGKIKDGVFDDRLIALYYALFVLNPDISKQYLDVLAWDANDMPLVVADPMGGNFNFTDSIYGGTGQYGRGQKTGQMYVNPNTASGGGKFMSEEQELREWLMTI